ncbi:PQQ-dependent catabolism-associated CXXCW motif protein [Plastorhodobacter daqingensis]|uniref:PQQ-dependent catabolism-associated CXXCW motif protein n=1 Tax=Plastorhodobacter daqingensis TaxID=1387281 RepID=A0ABW2UKM1_9RHOB
MHRLHPGMAALALMLLTSAPALAVDEPQGYRSAPYRAPVPATLAGAPALSIAQAAELHAAGAVFVDVLPHERRPEGLPEGTIWRSPPHRTIPGAIWLPGTGYDRIAPETESWFHTALTAMTGGDRTAPIVIFCKADCWMSWNAAKRAQELGFTHVRWFAEGQDGWAGAGLPLAEALPYPGAP